MSFFVSSSLKQKEKVVWLFFIELLEKFFVFSNSEERFAFTLCFKCFPNHHWRTSTIFCVQDLLLMENCTYVGQYNQGKLHWCLQPMLQVFCIPQCCIVWELRIILLFHSLINLFSTAEKHLDSHTYTLTLYMLTMLTVHIT